MFQLILPYLFIIAFGSGFLHILTKKFHFSLSVPEFIIASLIVGIFGLVGPMVIFGSVLHEGLGVFITFYFIISVLLFIYFVLSQFQSLISRLESFEQSLSQKITSEHILWFFLIVTLFLYSVYQLVQPLRGWDALNFYFPDAYVYFIADDFPIGNPLTFRPLYKEPCVSLLYTFVLATSGAPYFNLFAPLFLCILTLSTYELGMLFFQDQRKALLGSILSALLPISQTVFYEYAYYQDPAVSAFIAAAFLFYSKGLKQSKLFYYLLATFSFSLAVLCKFNAWAFALIFILITPTHQLGKLIRLGFLSLGCGFFLLQGIKDISLGMIFPILLIYLFVFSLILKQETPKKSQIIPPLLTIIGSFPLGILWFMRYANFLNDTPYSYYLSIAFFIRTQTGPTGILLIDEFLYLCQINFGFSLFFGIGAALALVIPQILGIWQSSKSSQILVIWFLVYSGMVYISYFGNLFYVLRYLGPIICPLALTCADGLTYLYSRLSSHARPLSFDLVCILLCYIFIPAGDGGTPQFIFQIQLLSDLGIHFFNSPWSVLSILIISNLFFLLLIYLFFRFPRPPNSRKLNSPLHNILALCLLLVLILLPIQADLATALTLGMDLENFSPIIQNDISQSVVIDFVKRYCPIEKGGLIVYDMPGLGFQLVRPVFDLFIGDNPYKNIFKNSGSNITHALSIMRSFQPDYPIKLSYIVIPEKNAWQHERFFDTVFKSTPLFHTVYNPLFFSRIYSTDYFSIYELKDNFPFKGIIDISLTDTKANSISLLPYFNQKTTGSFLDIWIDLSMSGSYNTTITAQLTISDLRHQNLQPLSTTLVVANQTDVHLSLKSLPQCNFFLEELIITIANPLDNLQYRVIPYSTMLFTFNNNQWSVDEGKGLLIS